MIKIGSLWGPILFGSFLPLEFLGFMRILIVGPGGLFRRAYEKQ